MPLHTPPPPPPPAEIVSRFASERERLSPALRKLSSTLKDLQRFADLVIAGKVPPSVATPLGMSLADAVNGLSALKPEELKSLVDERGQDLLLVGYLSSLAKTQVSVSEKLGALI